MDLRPMIRNVHIKRGVTTRALYITEPLDLIVGEIVKDRVGNVYCVVWVGDLIRDCWFKPSKLWRVKCQV